MLFKIFLNNYYYYIKISLYFILYIYYIKYHNTLLPQLPIGDELKKNKIKYHYHKTVFCNFSYY